MSATIFSVICMGVFGLLLVRWNRQDRISQYPAPVIHHRQVTDGPRVHEFPLNSRGPF